MDSAWFSEFLIAYKRQKKVACDHIAGLFHVSDSDRTPKSLRVTWHSLVAPLPWSPGHQSPLKFHSTQLQCNHHLKDDNDKKLQINYLSIFELIPNIHGPRCDLIHICYFGKEHIYLMF